MLHSWLWKSYISLNGFDKIWKNLDRFSLLNEKDSFTEITESLQKQIKYFASRSDAFYEWKEISRIKDHDEFMEAWRSLPIITKEDLKTKFKPEKIKGKYNIRGIISSTGGSTGEPTAFLTTPDMLFHAKALQLYSRIKVGWKPGMPLIILWGSERDIGKAMSLKGKVVYLLENYHLIDGYNLTDKTTDKFLELLERHDQVAVMGFTSMLEFIADNIKQRKIQIPKNKVATAWNGGEMLYDHQTDLFRETFGTHIYNNYGGRELNTMAFQLIPKGALSVLRPYIFIEIVNSEGKPASPGETGRLIVTSTINKGTPFIRYEIGDLGTYDYGGFDKSGIRLLKSLQGRDAGLWNINGKIINVLYWNHLFKDFPEVKQFQAVLKKDASILLRLKGNGFSKDRENHFIQVITGFLGNVKIEISWMSELPRTKQGKLLQALKEE